MKTQTGAVDLGVIGGLLAIALTVLGIYGWIANIVALSGSTFDPISGLVVLRVIGIFLAPLGSVLGFI